MGTVPNRKMNKKQLIQLLEDMLEYKNKRQEQEEKQYQKAPKFDCPICMTSKTTGIVYCEVQSHIICSECEKQYKQTICPICRQDKMQNRVIYCKKGDRKNINANFVYEMLKYVDFEKLKQKEQKVKYFTFKMLYYNGIEVMTDRYIKDTSQEEQMNDEIIEVKLIQYPIYEYDEIDILIQY